MLPGSHLNGNFSIFPQLEVTIVDKKTRLFATNTIMGRAVVDLEAVAEAGHKEDWFDLFEYDGDSD